MASGAQAKEGGGGGGGAGAAISVSEALEAIDSLTPCRLSEDVLFM